MALNEKELEFYRKLGILDIKQGSGIVIDKSDPRRPKISATGGGGGGDVNTINGIGPDSNGNVELNLSDIVVVGSGLRDDNGTIKLGSLDLTDGLLTEDMNLVRLYNGTGYSMVGVGEGQILNSINSGDGRTASITMADNGSVNNIAFQKTTSEGTQTINFNGTIGDIITISDTINNKGIEYAEDYSTNWTDHSLVTKKWVTDNFSGSSGIQTITGGTPNVTIDDTDPQNLIISVSQSSTTVNWDAIGGNQSDVNLSGFTNDLTSDNINEGTTNLYFTSSERTKLSGIEAGAQINVKSDWNAASGNSAEILNKPTLGSAASADTTDFATAAQGALANTAVQPAALAGYVPTSRTVNGKALTANISLTNTDVGAAATSHTHNASDINAGTLAIARIPTGTTSTTVSLGNHTHSTASTSVNGFMSSTDKTKLDGLFIGAYSNIIPITTNTTLSSSTHANSLIVVESNPVSLTINNSSLAVNQKIDVVDGAAVTFVADSVSIIRKTGKTLITTGENGGVTLIKIDDGIYWLVGDLTNV